MEAEHLHSVTLLAGKESLFSRLRRDGAPGDLRLPSGVVPEEVPARTRMAGPHHPPPGQGRSRSRSSPGRPPPGELTSASPTTLLNSHPRRPFALGQPSPARNGNRSRSCSSVPGP
jgi:hypothetical protein